MEQKKTCTHKEQLPTAHHCHWTSDGGAPIAANPPHISAVVNRWDRQTDSRLLHRSCSANYADNVKNY